MFSVTKLGAAAITPAPLWQRGRFRSQLLPRQRLLLVSAKQKGKTNDMVQSVISTGSKLVDQATEFVPDSVPRPVARYGVAIASGLLAWWLLQKVITTAITFTLIGGALFLYFSNSGGNDDDDNSKKDEPDLDDPLAEAQRIMKKYK